MALRLITAPAVEPLDLELDVKAHLRVDIHDDDTFIAACLEAARSTDVALKGGLPIAPRLAIERLVLAVCA